MTLSQEFAEELRLLIKKHAVASNIPDHIVADYMVNSLETFTSLMGAMEQWMELKRSGLEVVVEETCQIMRASLDKNAQPVGRRTNDWIGGLTFAYEKILGDLGQPYEFKDPLEDLNKGREELVECTCPEWVDADDFDGPEDYQEACRHCPAHDD